MPCEGKVSVIKQSFINSILFASVGNHCKPRTSSKAVVVTNRHLISHKYRTHKTSVYSLVMRSFVAFCWFPDFYLSAIADFNSLLIRRSVVPCYVKVLRKYLLKFRFLAWIVHTFYVYLMYICDSKKFTKLLTNS